MRRAGLLGAGVAVGSWFLGAVLMALVYRYPIPFAGHARGLADLGHVLWAAGVYGVAGGFLVVGAAGGAGGWWAGRGAVRRARDPRWPVVGVAMVIGLVGAIVAAAMVELIVG